MSQLLRPWPRTVLILCLGASCCLSVGLGSSADAQDSEEVTVSTLDALKRFGAERSAYRKWTDVTGSTDAPEPDLAAFRSNVEPVLRRSCVQCHGPDLQEGNVRIDSLDPDLLHGMDIPWWLEVFAVLSNGEMPPPDESATDNGTRLTDDERSRIVEWLAQEIRTASIVRHAEQGHSSFRRMTRYEYNFALQDLLGLPFDFARDLPPEAATEGGFQNSSEILHMSGPQFAAYLELGRQALRRATIRGERPAPLFWGVTMHAASADVWTKQEAELDRIRDEHKGDPETLQQHVDERLQQFQKPHRRTYYQNASSGRTAPAEWSYPEAKYAWAPSDVASEPPPQSETFAVLPPHQKLIVELGDRLPDEGTLRVRVRAARHDPEDPRIPSLQLEFGWQASNDSHASVRISERDLAVAATPDAPEFYQWEVPLSEIYPRNLVRNVNHLGDLPSPSEYIRLVNSTVSGGDLQIDYVEVTAPVYEVWPPESHVRIFQDAIEKDGDENIRAAQILRRFMHRAWRRTVTDQEVEQKLRLFNTIRPKCTDFQEATVEVLATVLSSPSFLYLTQSGPAEAAGMLSSDELATRLSMFLWCSIPDDELLQLAAEERLRDPVILQAQVSRMLRDHRASRFADQFVRQWLGMQLLDFLQVDQKEYPQFDPALKEAMQEEPVAFFAEVLRNNSSVIDFLHADYTVVNERLAKHYGLDNVTLNHFRRVSLNPSTPRGGLLTNAGLLAMNSDGKDSHPLKRGVWLLEKLLNDPPSPPPPAVPKIDLANPEIARMTLKERIANHRDQAACRSCHMKIDPWGIAFENFDAVGSWRTEIHGQPVDAHSVLVNHQPLNGIDGLKRFLLEHRQDQFVRAIVHKMTTFATGRPLSFGDRAAVDRITAELRNRGDGLETLVTLIVLSDLFQAK